jgi:hypothetical protein
MIRSGAWSDAEVPVELQGAFRAQPGHLGQLQDPGRYRRAQVLQRPDAPGLPVLGDLGRDRGAHAGNRPELFDAELADIVGPAADRTGRLLVVPGPEHVAAGDLGEFGVLAQERSDLFIHA